MEYVLILGSSYRDCKAKENSIVKKANTKYTFVTKTKHLIGIPFVDYVETNEFKNNPNSDDIIKTIEEIKNESPVVKQNNALQVEIPFEEPKTEPIETEPEKEEVVEEEPKPELEDIAEEKAEEPEKEEVKETPESNIEFKEPDFEFKDEYFIGGDSNSEAEIDTFPKEEPKVEKEEVIEEQPEAEETQESEKEEEFEVEETQELEISEDINESITTISEEETIEEEKEIAQEEEPKEVVEEEPFISEEPEETIEVEEPKEIKPIDPPRGWHLRKEFIDEAGNIFHKGEYVGKVTDE